LLHCSLVCRAWMPATRYHLFKCLHIAQFPHPQRRNLCRRGESFLTLVRSPNNIVHYIRVLSLDIEEPWLTHIVLAIPGARVTKLSIKIRAQPWKKPSSLIWILDVFPDLVDLAISPLFILHDETLRLLSHCKSLRTLTFTPYPNAEQSSKLPSCICLSSLNTLETLRLSTDAVLKWFQLSIASGWSPRLRTLDITLYRCSHKGFGHVKQLNLLLAQLGSTLEHLHISIQHYHLRLDYHSRRDYLNGKFFLTFWYFWTSYEVYYRWLC
jgi:hypothetical protein